MLIVKRPSFMFSSFAVAALLAGNFLGVRNERPCLPLKHRHQKEPAFPVFSLNVLFFEKARARQKAICLTLVMVQLNPSSCISIRYFTNLISTSLGKTNDVRVLEYPYLRQNWNLCCAE